LEATFLDAAGLTPSPGSQGICQSVSWQDATVRTREWALVEFRPSMGPFMQWTFVEDRYKLVLYRGHVYGELYDLQVDPHQLTNLFSEPTWASVRDDLVQRFRPLCTQEEIVRERTTAA
jgi:uncharacterized sulfatase